MQGILKIKYVGFAKEGEAIVIYIVLITNQNVQYLHTLNALIAEK